MDREKRIRQRIKEHYDEACSLGFEVVAIFLQGSQNYNCDEYTEEYQSDVDTKCIILPKYFMASSILSALNLTEIITLSNITAVNGRMANA